MSDPQVPVEEKQAIIDERVSMHGFQRGNIVAADGISVFDGNDYSDREYVRQAMQGNVFVSEPLISKITGELSIMRRLYMRKGIMRNQLSASYILFLMRPF